MLYILETALPDKKPLKIGLTLVYGIGSSTADDICRKLGFSPTLKVKDLNDSQISSTIKYIEDSKIVLNTELKTRLTNQKRNATSTKLVRGIRRMRGLPVRGQRTHTNARTSKKKLNE